SDRALQRALLLAAQHDANLEVVHVVDNALPQQDVERLTERAYNTVGAQLDALGRTEGVRVSTQIIPGEDFFEMLRRAEETDADLIVLGIHRHSTRPLFHGTTAERIIRLGRRPVLVVREPVVGRYKNAVVAVDLSPHSRRALETAVRLAPEANVQLIHATHVPYKGLLESRTVQQVAQAEENEFRRMMEQDLRDLLPHLPGPERRLEIKFDEGRPQDVIKEQAARLNADLVAIGTHGRSGIANAMLGSVAEDLLADAPTDVLAVKAW
ncbi:MAG: universal stress protein, partial [Hyphomicrobiaceae bacterium]